MERRLAGEINKRLENAEEESIVCCSGLEDSGSLHGISTAALTRGIGILYVPIVV